MNMSDPTFKLSLCQLRSIIRECLQEEYVSPGRHEKDKNDMILEDPPMDEVTPPGKEKLVRDLKKEKGVKNPWAVAWNQYNKEHGK